MTQLGDARAPDRDARRGDEPGGARRLRRRRGDGRARERDPARQERRQARPRAAEDRRERPEDYYKEVTLLEQAFVHDPSKTVAQVLKEAEAKAGAPVELAGLRPLRARRGHREGRRPGLRGRSRGGGGRRADAHVDSGRREAALLAALGPGMTGVVASTAEYARCRTRYRRVLVKLSGEALIAPDGYWLDPQTLAALAQRPGRRGQSRLRDRGGDRRRQHHPRRAHERRRLDRPRHRRFHGHAGHGDELARARDGAERGRASRRAPCRRCRCRRSARPTPASRRCTTSSKGQVRRARRRHRQSVLHHRYRRRAARRRIALRRRPEGDAGRRRLFRRPEDGPGRRSATTASPTTRRSRAISRSWTPRPSRWRARTACRSSSARSMRRARSRRSSTGSAQATVVAP